MKIILPYPDSRLLPNKKTSWQAKMGVTKECRVNAYYIIRSQVDLLDEHPYKSVTLTYTFYPHNGHMADFDSLYRACKPYQDALVDTQILADDSPKVIKSVTLQRGEKDKDNPRVEIEVKLWRGR